VRLRGATSTQHDGLVVIVSAPDTAKDADELSASARQCFARLHPQQIGNESHRFSAASDCQVRSGQATGHGGRGGREGRDNRDAILGGAT